VNVSNGHGLVLMVGKPRKFVLNVFMAAVIDVEDSRSADLDLFYYLIMGWHLGASFDKHILGIVLSILSFSFRECLIAVLIISSEAFQSAQTLLVQ